MADSDRGERRRPRWEMPRPPFGAAQRRGEGEREERGTTNRAGRDLNIGVQTVHNSTTYVVRDDASPEEKFAVAKRYVAGGRLRSAEELIREVVAQGFVTADNPSSLANEVAYYWTLSVLGDRSFELLDKDQFDQIEEAAKLARRGPRDDWRSAHHLLTHLIDCLEMQEENGTLAPERLDAFFDDFERLNPVHQEEIRRHLDQILSGAFQDRLAGHDAEAVSTQRMGGDRERRVWKFFEPDPAEPRPIPVHWPVLDVLQWTMAVWGVILLAGGLTVSAVLLASVSWKSAVVSGVLVFGFGALAAFTGPELLPIRYAPSPSRDPRASRRRRSGPGQREFAAHVQRTVQRHYDKHAPAAALQRPLWAAATRRSRTRLANEIIEVYGDGTTVPASVDWLIGWHAAEEERRWANGETKDPKRLLRAAGLVAGVIGVAAGWYVAVPRMRLAHPMIVDIALLWLVVGALLLVFGRADVHIVRRYKEGRWRRLYRERFAEEKAACRERRELLADRPSDLEMARWLDFDKLYLKSLAMNQYGLGNRDVVAHAFLTEALPGCRRARDRNGPSRYSAYRMWVFLLTAAGVRQMAVHFDFPTGIVKDQERTAFRYDAIVSAKTTEFGIRFDDGRRQRLLPGDATRGGNGDRNADRNADRPESSFVFYQVFELTLTNGQAIEITVENLEEWLLRRAGDRSGGEASKTPDLSDLTAALSILEAVAADGSEWIRRAQARRRRNASPGPGVPPVPPARHAPPADPLSGPYASPPPRGGSDQSVR